jgi:hypothetical protein
MNPPPTPAKPAPLRLSVFAAGGLLMLATLAVYANSLGRPFVFDDIPSIVDNLTIRQLRTALTPPGASGQTVSGRPLLNLSFALNYAVGGPSVGSYHALNVAIHLLAGLTLFGILRRTLMGSAGAQQACALTIGCHLPRVRQRAAVDRASAADGIGHLRGATGRILDGAVLPADALRIHPRRSLPKTGTVVCIFGSLLPAGHGDEGSHGLGTADGAVL